MKTHLFFFGKSESFSFQAYDEEGLIPDYDFFIKDFDKLESSVFTVDKVDNGEILARYIFSHGGKYYSLLKLYSYAQAFFSYRVEGSIYGVAFLSEHDIQITSRNLKLLQSLKESFAKLSLNGLKFKYENFEKDTTRIWQGFRNQSYFDKIDLGSVIQSGSSGDSVGIELSPLSEITLEISKIAAGRSAVYMSADRPHLERVKKKWDQYFDVYLLDGGVYVKNPKPKPVAPKPETITEGFQSNGQKQFLPIGAGNPEIEGSKDKQSSKYDGGRGILWIMGTLLFFSLSATVYLLYDKFYFEDVSKQPVKTEIISPTPILAPVRNDSVDRELVMWVLLKYDSLKKADVNKKSLYKKELNKRLHRSGIDTLKLKSLFK